MPRGIPASVFDRGRAIFTRAAHRYWHRARVHSPEGGSDQFIKAVIARAWASATRPQAVAENNPAAKQINRLEIAASPRS